MDQLTLYFDESGFTGENLLSEEQKTFAYASINIAHKEIIYEEIKKLPSWTIDLSIQVAIIYELNISSNRFTDY